MRHSIEPKDIIYVKGYGFLSFSKNMGTQLSSKYSQKPFDSAKKINNGCNKNCFQKSNPKPAEATGDLIGNKLLIKSQVLQKNVKQSCAHKIMKIMMNWKHRKKDTYLHKKNNKLLMN